MKTLEEIQYEVGSWSQANFGGNATAMFDAVLSEFVTGVPPADQNAMYLTPAKFPNAPIRPLVRLNELGPLLGMAEELGEFWGADSKPGVLDAVSDITIYLLDFCCRIGMVVPDETAEVDGATLATVPDAAAGISCSIGLLHHAFLKRIQNIHGMDDNGTFVATIRRAVENLVAYLRLYMAEHYEISLEAAVAQTWTTLVSKRRYKTNQPTGNENGD